MDNEQFTEIQWNIQPNCKPSFIALLSSSYRALIELLSRSYRALTWLQPNFNRTLTKKFVKLAAPNRTLTNFFVKLAAPAEFSSVQFRLAPPGAMPFFGIRAFDIRAEADSQRAEADRMTTCPHNQPPPPPDDRLMLRLHTR